MFEVMVMVFDSLRGQKNVFSNGKSFQYLVVLKKKLFIKIKAKTSGLKLVLQFRSIKACIGFAKNLNIIKNIGIIIVIYVRGHNKFIVKIRNVTKNIWSY
jgi:hypothetical protein